MKSILLIFHSTNLTIGQVIKLISVCFHPVVYAMYAKRKSACLSYLWPNTPYSHRKVYKIRQQSLILLGLPGLYPKIIINSFQLNHHYAKVHLLNKFATRNTCNSDNLVIQPAFITKNLATTTSVIDLADKQIFLDLGELAALLID